MGNVSINLICSKDVINVSEEEISNSLDFFLACAKTRNIGLMWKQRVNLMKASNGNLLPGQVLKAKSIKSINSSQKDSVGKTGSIKKINAQDILSSKNIGNDQSNSIFSPIKNDNYFKSNKYVGKAFNEDEFFDN